jgi:prolyl-tRNA synthetase
LPIAPFAAEVIPLSAKGEELEVAEKIYSDLNKAGIEVMIDDRDLRAGVKFADADLIGIPYHVVIGAKGLAAGHVEVKERKSGRVEKIKPKDVASYFLKLFQGVTPSFVRRGEGR